MTAERLQEIASYWCDLFEQFSVNTPIDRILPEYRVANDDITRRYPDFTIHDKAELAPFIKREMRRRKISFRRAK